MRIQIAFVSIIASGEREKKRTQPMKINYFRRMLLALKERNDKNVLQQ